MPPMTITSSITAAVQSYARNRWASLARRIGTSSGRLPGGRGEHATAPAGIDGGSGRRARLLDVELSYGAIACRWAGHVAHRASGTTHASIHEVLAPGPGHGNAGVGVRDVQLA